MVGGEQERQTMPHRLEHDRKSGCCGECLKPQPTATADRDKRQPLPLIRNVGAQNRTLTQGYLSCTVECTR